MIISYSIAAAINVRLHRAQKKEQDKVNSEKEKSGMYGISVSISTFHVCTDRRNRNISIDL
jgi:hypothetical protein